MVEVDENFQRVADQLVGFFSLDVDDETESAGVVFELRIIKALLRRRGNLSLRAPVISFIRWVAGHRSADKPAFLYFSPKTHRHAINVFEKLRIYPLEFN